MSRINRDYYANNSKVFSAVPLSAIVTLTSFAPAAALPLPTVSAPQASNAEQVQYRDHRRYYRIIAVIGGTIADTTAGMTVTTTGIVDRMQVR